MAANVTQSIFDVTSAAGAQFFAMLIGAFLASTGGFFVAWMLDRMERNRQERAIALVCLDLLQSLSVITNLADTSRNYGQPYGPMTLRMVRACMRDLEVYERNRERIADISNPSIRAEIYRCMASMIMAVEGILSESDLIQPMEEAIEVARAKGDSEKVEELSKKRQERDARRDGSFEFMVETTRDLCVPLSIKLRGVAKAEGSSLAAIVATNAQAKATIPSNPSTRS